MLKPHQKEIVDQDPLWFGLWMGAGSGKTLTSLTLAEGKILGIANKTQREDKNFEKNIEKFGLEKDITVISKEDFRKIHKELPYFDTVIVDEADEFFGIHPNTLTRKGKEIPKTSQLFDALKWYLRTHKPKRFYPLTATPASKPLNAFAILILFGLTQATLSNFFSFRNRYYVKRKKGYQDIYIQKTDEQTEHEITQMVKSCGETGKLDDWFEVPEQRSHTIYVDLTEEQDKALRTLDTQEPDPQVRRTRRMTIENGIMYTQTPTVTGKTVSFERTYLSYKSNKLKEVNKIIEKHKKVIIFVRHTASVTEIEKHCKSLGIDVFTMTGATKNRGELISQANESQNCAIIIQANISAGYNLPTFRATIFFSKSSRVRDYIQGIGRSLRLDHLDENDFYHLVVKGGPDESCHKAIMAGKDFYEKLMDN